MIAPAGMDKADALKRSRPEWSPWLAVVDEVLRETTTSRWDEVVPAEPEASRAAAPMLAGATIVVDGAAVRRLLLRLIEIASRGGTPKMASLRPALRGDVDVAALFAASIGQDQARVADIASAVGVDVEALQAVVGLIAVPFLHACRRRWTPSIPTGWTKGYCPVCGSWPAFAEVRGIERSRYLRCGRCGGEWRAHVLHCAYCGNDAHDDFVSLVPEHAGPSGAIEACLRCRAYVKAFTRLQGCAPVAVLLEDLASVALDVSALDQGYTRPSGAACPVDVTVTAAPAARRFLTWNA